jgi:hypothetical protein
MALLVVQESKEDKKMDFDKFDKMVDNKELKKQMEAAPEFDDVPKGTYMAVIDKMEIKPTKAGDKLMFAVQMGITETIDAPKKQDKRKIFFNRVICGNKTTERWNDGVAIKGVISWVEKLLDEGDAIEFNNYSQFAEEILDIYQDICPVIALKINYDPDAFNSIDILEVFDK